jgi:uncharacterized protein (DUF362 family)
MKPTPCSRGITRRDLLVGGTCLAAGLAIPTALYYGPGAWRAWRTGHAPSPFNGRAREVKDPQYAMPGPYPGRVVEVHHPAAVSPDNAIDSDTVGLLVDRGMAELTGAEPGDVKGAWGRFFSKGEIVGIKVNPVGRKRRPGDAATPQSVGSISSPALVVKVVECLKEVGIRPQDIVLFERYADEFVDAGYADLMTCRPLDGVRWAASAVRYTDTQLDVAGFDQGRDACSPELARHVAGYDPDVFTSMGFCSPAHSTRDERRFHSHLSAIVTRMVDKVINLPVLKDHRSAGVTLALKNLSHGMNNNVARSHTGPVGYGFGGGNQHPNGPNQCNTFIPQAASHHVLRQKVVLHILDGLIGVYEGGPGSWNRSWGTWRHNALFFATDPVAMDHVGWAIINDKRREEGWPPVEQMGLLHCGPVPTVRTALATLAGNSPLSAAALAVPTRIIQNARGSEGFNLRQPEHVILAGHLGLGVFPADQITRRRITLGNGRQTGA